MEQEDAGSESRLEAISEGRLPGRHQSGSFLFEVIIEQSPRFVGLFAVGGYIGQYMTGLFNIVPLSIYSTSFILIFVDRRENRTIQLDSFVKTFTK
ncbi:hypothetical protein FHS19_005037 [Paenibacillus rhizosphaerae]|uniref:Uncharacterized protein n=1 Tax=Paenibacillus rhizosphaerae TaxID=297318 RepID=A0A839TUE2_9BACL|nr:hypothetical protein [Paenibacillus rhizosphaerae]